MVRCAYCGKEVALPFKCRYCGKFYCAEHRLPEAHECMWRPLPVELRKKIAITAESGVSREEEEYETYYVQVYPSGKIKNLGKGSLLDFAVGVFAVFVAGLSYFLYNMDLVVSVEIGIIFAAAYAAHEGAHYAMARHMGLNVYYVLNPTWLLVLTITLVLPFKFIFPGTVIVHTQNRKMLARVATAGPASNLVLSALAMVSYVLIARFWWLLYMMLFSSMIGLLNMLPLSVFDGEKIFHWNKGVWGGLTAGHMVFVILFYSGLL